MRNKLDLAPIAGVDETPASYLSRLAATNFVSAREFAKDFDLSFQSIVDGCSREIRKLCELGGTTFHDLMKNTVRRTGPAFALRSEELAKDSIRRVRVLICPACVAQDIATSVQAPGLTAYGRLAWTLSPVRTCSRHSIALVEVARDLKPGVRHDFVRNIASAIPRIPRILDRAIHRPPSGLERYLLDRVDGCASSPWLDKMPFFAVAKTAETIGAVAEYGRTVNLKKLSENQRYTAGGAGFEILHQGEAGFTEFLAGLHKTYQVRRFGSEGPQALLGRVYTTFGQGLPDKAYDPVRDVISRFVKVSLPLGPEQHIFGKPVGRRVLHSIRSASIEHAMHPKRLRKLVIASGLAPDPSLPDRKIVFEVEAAKQLIERERTSMTLNKVPQYLNVPTGTFRVLFQAGLIRRHSLGEGELNEVFYRRELDEFLTSILKNSREVPAGDLSGHHIPAAARRARCSAVSVVRLIQDGRLSWIGRRPDVRGFLSVLVKVDEIRPFVAGEELRGLPIGKTTSKLHIHHRVMKGLIRLGAIRTERQRNPVSRNMVTIITYDELSKFSEEFVSLFMLARERRKHMPAVLHDLRAIGVRPVHEFESVGATFFRRSEVP
ncbi:TniQ family protein [Tardiphaga sp. 285_C5_N1_2]|uniref:TniQ family protein n=1 Tax=Tardiphaga sp. 285_C5_N1_2 TaxID=3240775 RepID=UPI003F895A0C